MFFSISLVQYCRLILFEFLILDSKIFNIYWIVLASAILASTAQNVVQWNSPIPASVSPITSRSTLFKAPQKLSNATNEVF